jgi:hypothetical protein
MLKISKKENNNKSHLESSLNESDINGNNIGYHISDNKSKLSDIN